MQIHMSDYPDFDETASEWPGVKEKKLGVVRIPRTG